MLNKLNTEASNSSFCSEKQLQLNKHLSFASGLYQFILIPAHTDG